LAALARAERRAAAADAELEAAGAFSVRVCLVVCVRFAAADAELEAAGAFSVRVCLAVCVRIAAAECVCLVVCVKLIAVHKNCVCVCVRVRLVYLTVMHMLLLCVPRWSAGVNCTARLCSGACGSRLESVAKPPYSVLTLPPYSI
jgi:hypothetical protein